MAETVEALKALLNQHKDKRVVVLGTTCVGKSTLVEQIPEAEDMDKVLFPQLSEEEKAYVCQEPWTPEIGAEMSRLTKERVVVSPGKPVFGTVLLDADFVILLTANDEILTKRAATRAVSINDVRNMQTHLENDITSSGIPSVVFPVD